VTRFLPQTLIAIVALVVLTGDASAAFRPVWSDEQGGGVSVESSGTAVPLSPAEPTPKKPEIQDGVQTPLQSGTGTSSTSTNTSSPGGMPGVLTEPPSPAVPFVTLLRLVEERVALIPPLRSVFEPPRTV